MEQLAKKIEILQQVQSVKKEYLYRLLKNEILTKLTRISCTGFWPVQDMDFEELYSFLHSNKVIGLISKKEAQTLFQLARHLDGPIIEVGTHFGFSTIFLAKHQNVYTIDFQFEQKLKEVDPGFRCFFSMFYDDWADLITDITDEDSKLEVCQRNWKTANVSNKIIPIAKDAMQALQDVPLTSFMFYDACHDYQSVNHIDAYFNKVVSGGVIAIHDFNWNTFGVVGAVYDFYSRNQLILEGPFLTDSLIWFKRRT